MTSLKSLTGACLVAIAAIGLGGCPAMSALSFVSADEVVKQRPGLEAKAAIYLVDAPSLPLTVYDDFAEPPAVMQALEKAGCVNVEQRTSLAATSYLVASGAKLISSWAQGRLADHVDRLAKGATQKTKAEREVMVDVPGAAQCIAYHRFIEGLSVPTRETRGKSLDLVIVLKKKDFGDLRYYEAAGAQGLKTIAITKPGENGEAASIDLVVGLSITGAIPSKSGKPPKALRYATTIDVDQLKLTGEWQDASVKSEPFQEFDTRMFRYAMVVTEVGDLGFVSKDAKADIETFFELLGPSYEAFVQNRVITPLEN